MGQESEQITPSPCSTAFPPCWETKSLRQEQAYSGVSCILLHSDANLQTLWYKSLVPTYGSKYILTILLCPASEEQSFVVMLSGLVQAYTWGSEYGLMSILFLSSTWSCRFQTWLTRVVLFPRVVRLQKTPEQCEQNLDKERLDWTACVPQATEPRPADWKRQQGTEPAPSSTGDISRLSCRRRWTDWGVFESLRGRFNKGAVFCHFWCLETNSLWPLRRQVQDLLCASRKAFFQGIRRGGRRLTHREVGLTPPYSLRHPYRISTMPWVR